MDGKRVRESNEQTSACGESDNGSSAGSSVNDAANDRIVTLARRVHAKLCVPDDETLAVKAHRQAVQSMLELRNLLMQSADSVTQEVRVLLLTAGVSVQRRVAVGEAAPEETSDLSVSLALLFMLQVLCDPGSSSVSDTAEEMDTDAGAPPERIPEKAPSDIALWGAGTLKESVMARRRGREEQEGKENGDTQSPEAEEPVGDGGWSAALRLTPEMVSRAALLEAPLLGAQGTLAKLTPLATTFFRSSALAMQYSLLQGTRAVREEKPSFLTLSTVDFLQDANDDKREKRLAAIVDAAESEAGQQACNLCSNDALACAILHPKCRGPYIAPAHRCSAT